MVVEVVGARPMGHASVARGNSNKIIARKLGISDQTVKNHVSAILRKLEVNDRTEAVVYALRNGWIRIDSPVGG